jgi:capsular polysaccharide export protein
MIFMTNTLLLQGPVGPFFDQWAQFLKKHSTRTIWKIHFNSGDSHFYHHENSSYYDGTLQAWPSFFKKFAKKYNISEVFLCGDCRPYHHCIIPICQKLSIAIWVFEEGYLRNHYITLEKGGVNVLSDDYKKPLTELQPSLPLPQVLPYQRPYTLLSPLLLSIRYYVFITFEKITAYISKLRCAVCKTCGLVFRKSSSKEQKHFPKQFSYQHYRSISPKEIFYFMRSFARKVTYVTKEHEIRKKLRQFKQRSPFIVPLQIAKDSQITEHSHFPNIEAFITEILQSFAKIAPADIFIVFKHHPLDRGHCHYGTHINDTARQLQIDPQRVFYVHTTPLSFFWPRALGCVVINSTSGFSALQNGIPTICLGKCLYDHAGITHKGSLDDFWKHPQKPQRAKVQQLENYWKSHVLIQTSFYHPLQHDLWDCTPPYLREQFGLTHNLNQS